MPASGMSSRHLIISLLFALLPQAAQADVVQVAAAANFSAPMAKIAAAFQKASGHQALLSFGATGKFYAQIRNGAPFAVLLAADNTTAAKLEQEQLAVAGTRFTYASGKLVLWSADPALVDNQGAVLRNGGFRHLSIANPNTAPYGAAALETLQKLDLLSHVQPRFVQGESIAHAYQFVRSGNAELGFVALSQVYRDGRITAGSAWIVSPDLYSPLHQEAVLLQPGATSAAARALLDYLQTDSAKTIMQSYGYSHSE